MKNLMLCLLLVAVLTSCSSTTEIVKTWMAPGATVTPAPQNKALVVAVVKDETSRRVIEDRLAKRLNASATQSYKILSPDLLKEASEETLNLAVREGNYSHILLMRLVDVKDETFYVPGTSTAYYSSYGGYYRYGANVYSTPGHYHTDKNYFIETTVYSVEPDKLLWTGTTKTINPSNIDKAVNEIADAVTSQMRKDGFLK